MTDVIILIGLIVVSLGGIVLAAFQLPGVWLALAAAAAFDWYHDWSAIGWQWLLGLTLAASLAEVLELAASSVIARRAGASRRASIAAVVGGIAGMLLLSVPVPIIGTILGGLIGCFVGAIAAELSVRDDWGAGAKVGLAATVGRVLGILLKTSSAVCIAGAIVVLAILS